MDNLSSASAQLCFLSLVLGLLLACLLRPVFFRYRYHIPLPPGPRPLPLLGNTIDLPANQPWTTFSMWGDIYGGIVHVAALGQSIVILNDAKYAVDMLDKKGLLYSDRPTLVMGGQLVGWEESPALSPFCERWQEYRRMFSNFMGTKAKIEGFYDVLYAETHVYLQHVLNSPEEWVEHSRRLAGGIVLQLAYGYKASDPGGEELVRVVDEAVNGFSETTKTNAFLVDIFPILRFVPSWFPGTAWKQKAASYRAYLEEMLHAPFEFVKQQLATGVARPSFTRDQLAKQTHSLEQERVIQWAAAGIYSGGADTTVAGIEAFVLCITRHLEQQQIALAEIDRVIGHDRLPTFASRECLPYCEGLYLEVMRYYTTVPLGLAHSSREDDVHDGYFIPKGSIVFANNWRFFRDPTTYPDPEVFRPERFIGANKQLDPRKYLFGYGRRVCPGIHLADASMWLACISILAAFEVNPPVKNGRPVIPPAEFLDGTISHPRKFECVIRPRSTVKEIVVRGLSVDA